MLLSRMREIQPVSAARGDFHIRDCLSPDCLLDRLHGDLTAGDDRDDALAADGSSDAGLATGHNRRGNEGGALGKGLHFC